MPNSTDHAFNVADLRRIAKRRLPKGIFEYIDRGSEDELLLHRNRAAFERLHLLQRSLVDVSERSTSANFMGQTHAMPVALAPTGAAGLLWHEGELAIAQAAAAANLPFTLSTNSMTALEKVAKVGGRLWFQLYVWADRGLSHELVARVQRSGFEGLMVTVDTPIQPNREHNARNGFSLPFNPSVQAMADMLGHPGWLLGVLFRYLVTTGMPAYENFPEGHRRKITKGGSRSPLMRCDTLNWDDISRLRELWKGSFMVKGIMNPEDAVKAFQCGADAVIVSNHGGRNLDSAMATMDLLPEILEAVGSDAKVIVDSGIRRGSDIAKAIALGAHGVMIGRAPLYGVAAAGREGASRAIELLRQELDITLGMVGRCSMAELTRDMVRVAHDGPAPATSTRRAEPRSGDGTHPRPATSSQPADDISTIKTEHASRSRH